MLMYQERLELIEYGKKLIENKLTKGTGGNLSVFDREKKLMAITPSGIDFFQIQPEDIVIMDLDANIVEGNRKPSSEWEMHLLQYKQREDIDSVIHAHTKYSTALSCLNMDLPATHYVLASCGSNSVKCAKYASYGTHELAVNAAEAMMGSKAVLLANHGVLSGDKTLSGAFSIIEDVEYVSELYILAKSIGNPVILPDSEMENIIEKFKGYGQK